MPSRSESKPDAAARGGLTKKRFSITLTRHFGKSTNGQDIRISKP